MRLPSLVFILSAARQALCRFPLAMLSISVAGICALLLVDNETPGRLIALLMTAQMGLPLLLALTLLGERSGWGPPAPPGDSASPVRSRIGAWFLLQLGGVLLLAGYYFSLPDMVEGAPLIRFFQLNIGLHLLVACIAFIRRGGNNSVWQFNRLLFQRLLAGVVFTFTLFAGLSLAIFALDKLFGLTFDDEIYARLFMLVGFIFNSWYFLGGIPRDLDSLERPIEYPKILKIFAQYILTILVAIYLSILMIYLVKVLITTEWPSGWIGYLVSSVAVAGLFSLVTLYPLADRKENHWIATYARLFYILLLPAVAMLLLAIYKRVDQYGVTENRYFLIIIAFWLVFTAVKGLIEKRPNLKILPLSLCLLAFLASCGPWGAFSIARESQVRRVAQLLTANGMLVGEILVPPTDDVSGDDAGQIGDVLDYLVRQHGPESISHWFDDELTEHYFAPADSLISEGRRGGGSGRVVMDYLGLEYVAAFERTGSRRYHFTRDAGDELLMISEYDFARPIVIALDKDDTFEFNSESYEVIRSAPESGLLFVVSGDQRLNVPLHSLLSTLAERSTHRRAGDPAPGELLTIEKSGTGIRVMLAIQEIRWIDREDKSKDIQKLEGILFITEE